MGTLCEREGRERNLLMKGREMERKAVCEREHEFEERKKY